MKTISIQTEKLSILQLLATMFAPRNERATTNTLIADEKNVSTRKITDNFGPYWIL